jgi:hypothetical protein
MSSHYTLSLHLTLRSDLTDEERSILLYLFEGKGTQPKRLPSHEFFNVYASKAEKFWQECQLHLFNNPKSLQDYWARCTSKIWSLGSKENSSYESGLHIHIIGNKLEGIFDNAMFVLLQWFATLSNTQGYIGVINVDDNGTYDHWPTFFLFSYDQELYGAAVPDGINMESFSHPTKTRIKDQIIN